MIDYNMRFNIDLQDVSDDFGVITEESLEAQEKQRKFLENLRAAIDEDRNRFMEKLAELYRRSDETNLVRIDPIPLLAPDASQDEIIDVVNRMVVVINEGMANVN